MKIKIIVAHTRKNNDLSLVLPLITRDGSRGFEFRHLLAKAMDVYQLQSDDGVSVEYMSKSKGALVNI